jgi:hypothetical protein
MTDFGLDLSSLYDVDDSRTVTGVALVAEDAFWRLRTAPSQGILEGDAPEYGYDLEGAIGAIDEPSQAAGIEQKIEGQLGDDPRISEVTATIVRVIATTGAVSYDIQIHCDTADGPFDIVGTADASGLSLAVKLLPGGI